jgi:hypothetical protein
MRDDKLVRKVNSQVTEVLGYPPVNIHGYDRGVGTFWELRDTGEDKHAWIQLKVVRAIEKTLAGLEPRRFEVNLTMKGKTTRVFLFLHDTREA